MSLNCVHVAWYKKDQVRCTQDCDNAPLYNNTPLTLPLSGFISALDKSNETVISTISFQKPTSVVTTLIF